MMQNLGPGLILYKLLGNNRDEAKVKLSQGGPWLHYPKEEMRIPDTVLRSQGSIKGFCRKTKSHLKTFEKNI